MQKWNLKKLCRATMVPNQSCGSPLNIMDTMNHGESPFTCWIFKNRYVTANTIQAKL